MKQRHQEWNMPAVTIRATCPTCGDVELTGSDVVVRICMARRPEADLASPADGDFSDQGSYAFRCPACALAVSKLADSAIVDLLVSSGVRIELWDLPAELDETHVGPAFTVDDLLDFHYALQGDGWLEQLVTGEA